jgi:aminoglycoside phosphotransferase (APT) family kinase protein
VVAAETPGRLRRVLAGEHPDWGVGGVADAGAGLTCHVYRVETRALGPLAVRVPHVRWIADGNNVGQDAWDLLRQEAALTEHARAHGVPCPRLHDLRLGGALDYLATDYAADDGGEIADESIGGLVARIHAVPPPGLALAEQGDLDAAALVGGRLRHRFGVVQTLTGNALREPDWERVDELLAWPGERRLLHMDVRRVNLRGVAGRVTAVFDWANAVVADAALELARIAEFGGLSERFLDAYGRAAWEAPPPAVRTLYRLDTAVMLCVVFLHELEDTELAPPQLARASALLEELRRG